MPAESSSIPLLTAAALSPLYGTAQTRQAMADPAVANLREHFAGRPLPAPVPECQRGTA